MPRSPSGTLIEASAASPTSCTPSARASKSTTPMVSARRASTRRPSSRNVLYAPWCADTPISYPTAGPRAELPEHAEPGFRERHADDLGGDERSVGELVERTVVREVEPAERREEHPATEREGRVDAQVNRGVLERDLAGAVLELELGGHPHVVAHARAREEVEALDFEPGVAGDPRRTLVPRVRFGVAADRGAAEQTRLERLVVDAAAHERALRAVGAGGVASLQRVALLRRGRGGEGGGGGGGGSAQRHEPQASDVVPTVLPNEGAPAVGLGHIPAVDPLARRNFHARCGQVRPPGHGRPSLRTIERPHPPPGGQ